MSTRRRTLRVSGPRPLWRDPRFLGGLALIAISILACTWLVADARAGVSVYRTTRAVAVGEPLDASNTALVDARIPAESYVLEGAMPQGGLAARSMGAGELVARGAVTTQADGETRRLVVSVADGLPASAEPGDLLELWALPRPARGTQAAGESRLVAGDVVLVRILDEESSLSRSGSRIEILIDASALSQVLDAMSGGDALAAVPIGAA